MKNLSQFVRFDWDSFAEGKDFQVTCVKPWKDYQNQEKILGTVIEVFISQDLTHYITRDGSKVSNRGEKLSIKVPGSNLEVDIDDYVTPVNPVATVFGEYRNQLSVRADDIIVIKP